MRVFFDSSAFAKRYVCEDGTPAVLAADVFISADQRQREAAARAGLRVEAV
jgi:hypothetical protein